MLPPLGIVSPRNAKTNAFGIVAPRRFSMIGCGIAITSALIMRVPGGQGMICTGGAVAGAALGAASFAGSVSGLIAVGETGVAVSSVALGIAGFFDAESG